jgi:hypothetical protein
MGIERRVRGRWASATMAAAIATGAAVGAVAAIHLRSAGATPPVTLPYRISAGPARPSTSPTQHTTLAPTASPSALPATPSPHPRAVTNGPSTETHLTQCHFLGAGDSVQVRPETAAGEDLVVFLDARDAHPCRALIHYTFSVLDPAAPGGPPLLSATGTLDRALASSRLSIPVSSAIAVAWTNWCGAPGTYTVQVTTDANFYYPGASAQAASPGCADKHRAATFEVIDWLNQLDALSASVGGINVGETADVTLNSPTGVYAIGVDGVLFLGDPGLLGCTPTCAQVEQGRLTLVSPTSARVAGDHFSIDLVAAGPVPDDARPAAG